MKNKMPVMLIGNISVNAMFLTYGITEIILNITNESFNLAFGKISLTVSMYDKGYKELEEILSKGSKDDSPDCIFLQNEKFGISIVIRNWKIQKTINIECEHLITYEIMGVVCK